VRVVSVAPIIRPKSNFRFTGNWLPACETQTILGRTIGKVWGQRQMHLSMQPQSVTAFRQRTKMPLGN